MTKSDKKQGGALGRGLDALISKEYVKDSETETVKEEIVAKEPVESIEESAEVNVIHQKIIDAILEDVQKNPRVSFWSARTAAVLRFLRKTEPEFSISSEASLLMEEAVKEKYPEIWEMFEEHL
ncbi:MULTISPECIES: hypothetical protein [Methanobacterium]|uniref:Uncharacterized protein n=1 Tax=Methanobacterium bryantii TaxID=2161 RepID=A0A2A2H5Y1_METBR|nr:MULTISPECIES: hypothetical protein [Methanobacterium]OEC88777.1 hypothetical protein A9507_03605 [Methanobacterium sp. A39]PAV04787.1 hypothetical protein ASJ80_10770 [Methanobacterium bryantii]